MEPALMTCLTIRTILLIPRPSRICRLFLIILMRQDMGSSTSHVLRGPTRLKLLAMLFISGPFMMSRTRTASWKGRSGSSLGVSRKHWGVPGWQAASTSSLKILRSFTLSMPWLISSTTLNGATVTSCHRKACIQPFKLTRVQCPKLCDRWQFAGRF